MTDGSHHTTHATTEEASHVADDTTSIDELAWRSVAAVSGVVRSIRYHHTGGAARVELTLYDDTGGLRAYFTASGPTEGVRLGDRLTLRGRVGDRHGTLAMMNPDVERDG